MVEPKTSQDGVKAFWKTPLGIIIQAAIIASMTATAVQVIFPWRKDAYTQNDAAKNKYELLAELDAKFSEHEDSFTVEIVEIMSSKDRRIAAEVDAEIAGLKLYVRENFLPNGTLIPPPQVESSLELAHEHLGRHDNRLHDLGERINECCYRGQRSEIESMWHDGYRPVVPGLVLGVSR